MDAPCVRLRAALPLERTVAALHSVGAACGGALHPKNVVLAASVREGGAASLIAFKDAGMFEGDNDVGRRGKGADMRDLGAAPGLPRVGGHRLS